jgi:hypothetical protein
MLGYRSTNQRIAEATELRDAVAGLGRAIAVIEQRLENARTDVGRLVAEQGRRQAAITDHLKKNPRAVYDFFGGSLTTIANDRLICEVPPELRNRVDDLRPAHEAALSEAGTLEARLGGLRISLNVARERLAQAEAELSAGERLATGQPAAEYTDHRERLAVARERQGLPPVVA